MRKRWIIFSLSLLFLFVFIFFTTAQSSSRTITDQGSNFERTCMDDKCDTVIFSYEKYFNRDGQWEEISENWQQCGEEFCTNEYHFKVIADQNARVVMQLDNEEFIQQISTFKGINLTLSTPTIDGSMLTYQNILRNVDLRYQYLPHKLKEEIVINEPLNNINEDFEINFSLSGDALFNLEEPFICDDNGNCIPLNYTLSSDQISLIIPSRFLNSPRTAYPVIIDPSFSLSKSSIIWNGMVQEYDDGELIGYFRVSNPSRIYVGIGGINLESKGVIDWNLDSIPNAVSVVNATLKLFFEKFTAPNTMNITHMNGNSSQYANDITGNLAFYTDSGDGDIYSNYSSSLDSTNAFINFKFNDKNLGHLVDAFATTKRFSTGMHGFPNKNITISARDHPIPIQRPILIIQTTKEDYNLTYDSNGNMIQGFGKYLEYDSWNRLSKVRNTSSTGNIIAEYFYDHEGKRILKKTYNLYGDGHNESTYYLNTRPADFIEVRNTNGTIINETYIYLQDKLIAKFDTKGKKFFYHPDHLGNTNLITNESGDAVEDLLYLPYGNLLIGNEISRFGYTGQENDVESGFMDYGARQYNPQFARFLQPDPVISDVYNPQNLNRYAYVLNNPYKYTDPTGNIVDIVVDVGFIGYDIYTIIKDPSSSANYIALAADVGGAIIPGVTGLGLAVRTTKAADKALDVAATADKLSDTVKGVNALENAKDAEKVAQVGGGQSSLIKQNYQKGMEGQKTTLDALGLPENTQTFQTIDPKTGQPIGTRPDSLGNTGSEIMEVKNSQYVTQSSQLRAQENIAKESGKTPTLITGTHTRVSKWVGERFNIVRVGWLGPRRGR